MKEELLHYVWRTRKFDIQSLVTVHREPLQILHFGDYNRDSGPDFKNGRIRIKETLWVGHIEMHIKSSDWYVHQHQNDPAYENVILHVVFEYDKPIYYANGKEIPCLILDPNINRKLIANYQKLQYQKPWVACEHAISDVSPIKQSFWFDRMLTERLIQKADRMEELLIRTNYDWETCFYASMARSFGFLKNGDTMESLALLVPLNILKKHFDQPHQIEALLFGCGGFLDVDMSSSYGQTLQEEYFFLKEKFQLTALNPVQWQFFRMRPANFPTIRIAQFAHLICRSPNLLADFLQLHTIEKIEHWLSNICASQFWETHFHFHKESPLIIKKLGKQSIMSMVINTLAPFLFIYGKYHQRNEWIQRSIDIMTHIPAEKNRIIRNWKKIGVKPSHAGHTQALLYLKKAYCERKACLDCGIGHEILNQTSTRS